MKQNLKTCISLHFLAFCLLLGACGGGASIPVPDAPPPWQEVSVPGSPSVSGSQPLPPRPTGLTYGPRPSWRDRFPPPPLSGSPYEPPRPSTPSPSPSAEPAPVSPSPSYPAPTTPRPVYSAKPNYTVKAYANVWVLVQDKNGNELEWLSMKAGDEVPIMHRGPLTITCSSGKSVKITDKYGKKVDAVADDNRINIVRLP